MFTFNTIKRFIKRFISSFVILLLLDIIVFVILGYQQTQETSATDTVNQIAQNFSFDNSVTLSNEGKKSLNKITFGSWSLILKMGIRYFIIKPLKR